MNDELQAMFSLRTEYQDCLRPTGLVIPKQFAQARFREFCKWIALVSESSPWWIGDAAVYGQDKYEWSYSELQAITGLSQSTVENRASVSRRVPQSRRKDSLSWSHHEIVAAYEPEKQSHWLSVAEQDSLSCARLTAVLNGQEDRISTEGPKQQRGAAVRARTLQTTQNAAPSIPARPTATVEVERNFAWVYSEFVQAACVTAGKDQTWAERQVMDALGSLLIEDRFSRLEVNA